MPRHFSKYLCFLFLFYTLTARAATGACAGKLAAVERLPPVLRLNEAEARVAARDPRYARLVGTLGEIFGVEDPEFMISVASALIENPNYGRTGRALLARNPFFRDFPERRGPGPDITYLALRERFGTRLTSYAAGVLASLAPTGARVIDPTVASGLPLQDHARADAPFRRLMGLEVYREAAIQILSATGQRFTPAVRLIERSPDEAADLINYGVRKSKELSVALRRRKYTSEDLANVHGILVQIAMTIFAREDLDPRNEMPELRRIFRRQAPAYLRTDLGFDGPIEALQTLIIGAALQDPRPLGQSELEQHLIGAARRLLQPLRELAKPVEPTLVREVSTSPPPPAAPPGRDSLAFDPPPAPKARLKTRPLETAAPATPTEPPGAPTIAPERDLAAFAANEGARPWRELRARHEYRMIFASHPDEVQTIVFDERAVMFMQEYPPEAKRMVRGLSMGETSVQATGLKPMALRSQRYGGVIYEIFIGGKYRPMVVYVNGVWQVIRVAHTDDVARAIKFVTPIARR